MELSHIDTLPQELITQILSYLDEKELVRCSGVNKKWLHLSRHNFLWYNLCCKERLVLCCEPQLESQSHNQLWYLQYVSENKRRRSLTLRKHAEKIQKTKSHIQQSPPLLLDFLTLPMILLYLAIGTIVFLLVTISELQQDNIGGHGIVCLQRIFDKFIRLSYGVMDGQQELFRIGLCDLALLYTLSVIGPLACNLFQVGILKPLMLHLIADETQSPQMRQQFYKDGWLLAVVTFLNVWAFFSFPLQHWKCAFFPWFCDTTTNWWIDFPVNQMTFGVKWFFLIMIANDGYALAMTLLERFVRYPRKNGIPTSELLNILFAYFLLVYSYLNGYARVASAILTAHNFADLFLYMYKLCSIKVSTPWMYIPSSISAACFILLFIWTRVLCSPKIIYSIFVEAPRYSIAISTWLEWAASCVLIGGMQLVYFYWFALLGKGLKNTTL